ncbi:MAG: hypothetical protein ACUVWZ_16590 [Anaerolineae bacterium]
MLTPIPERSWGRVTELAQTYGVSRPFRYELRDRAFEALGAALAPRQPGPPPQAPAIIVDRDFLRRAITVLPWLKGTVRDIQLGLALLFQTRRSVGYISETLQEGGAAAAADNASFALPQAVLGEADEIFQGRRPCLTVVDGRSFLALHLAPAEAGDSTTWGVTLLDLQARGIQFQDLASDGATGIRAGAREARLMVPLREVAALAQKLEEHLEELVSPLAWIEQSLSTWRTDWTPRPRPSSAGPTSTVRRWPWPAAGLSPSAPISGAGFLGNAGPVSSLVQPGRVAAQLAPPVLADSPRNAGLVDAPAAMALEPPPVSAGQARRAKSVGVGWC